MDKYNAGCFFYNRLIISGRRNNENIKSVIQVKKMPATILKCPFYTSI